MQRMVCVQTFHTNLHVRSSCSETESFIVLYIVHYIPRPCVIVLWPPASRLCLSLCLALSRAPCTLRSTCSICLQVHQFVALPCVCPTRLPFAYLLSDPDPDPEPNRRRRVHNTTCSLPTLKTLFNQPQPMSRATDPPHATRSTPDPRLRTPATPTPTPSLRHRPSRLTRLLRVLHHQQA